MERSNESNEPCVIIGAGPAGLTAAYELSKLGVPAVVFEQDDIVGGISRTAVYKDYRFDIGGHRFFTKVDFVREIWDEILGDEFLDRPRLSRIFYDDTFFDYPLKPFNALRGLGLVEAVRIGLSYLRVQLFPSREEVNFEQWVSNRFGKRLYEIFFKTYTEKVWGMPCTEIGADWAAQRIQNLDLFSAVKNALLGSGSSGGEVVTTLIDSFRYPRLGPGMMWERCVEILAERGYPTHLGSRVERIRHRDGRVQSVTVRDASGQREVSGSHFVSSMPIRSLVRALDPPPPAEVLAAAERLRYRDFLTVVLIVKQEELFPDNWIYIHSPKVQVGRIQNFKSWSPEMIPDPSTCSLGLEYFVQEGDDLWTADDDELVALGIRECETLGLVDPSDVTDGTVVRMPKAYPVYDHAYKAALATIRGYLDGLPNLQLTGRNGQHRYNNQDHSMATAVYAARNIAGASYDIWDVNVDDEYHEEIREDSRQQKAAGDRLVPQRIARQVQEDLIRSVFARYDPVALGGAVGAVSALGLLIATTVLLVQGGDVVGPTLGLLSNYLVGFQVSWAGAFVGTLEAAIGGFGIGYAMARTINAVVHFHERRFRRRYELTHMMDVFDQEPPG